jgi:2-octaprenyl-6-methoxyphenol hydroxylase
MNICLIGESLTSLALAKSLVNKKINVFLFTEKKKNKRYQTRTLGISKKNFDFFDQNILKIKKDIFWGIDQIEIFIDRHKNDKLLNFDKNNETLFSMLKHKNIYDLLNKSLRNKKIFKKFFINDENFYKKIMNKNRYDLIINFDPTNKISKKYFNKKIIKDYNSSAYTTVLKHESLRNKKAIQIFTKYGPIAFLPISKTETSVVFSIVNQKKKLSESKVFNLIKKFNLNYKIKNFKKLENYKLNFHTARNYYFKNIMNFGDNLHKIHPVAGQGFNMTLRDIKIFSEIIEDRLNLGLQLDYSIYEEFEKKTKHLNFLFSNGIDFIYEFFKNENIFFTRILKQLNNKEAFKKIFQKYADQGF